MISAFYLALFFIQSNKTAPSLEVYCLETKRRRTVSISFSKVMEATPKRKRVLPQWLLESSANYHATNKPNPPPTKRSKMSKEDQLLGPVRGKRPLKDISNYAADPKQRRREKDLARKRAARAKESDKEKAKRLNYQKEYVKDKRCRETDGQYESRLCDLRMRAKNLCARETDEQSEARLEDLRMRAQNRYATETDEQHQARLDDLRTRAQERYASETHEQHQARLDDLRTRAQERYASETHEQHQARLDDLRTRAQERYASEPDEQYQVRLEDARMRVQERRANESDEQRQIRLSCLCQRDHETRGTETDEQRATRYQRMREYRQQLATNQPPPAPSPERAHQLELLRKDLKTFHKEIRQSPTSTCCTCDRLCYPKGTSLIDVGKVHDVLQQHYRFAMNEPQVS